MHHQYQIYKMALMSDAKWNWITNRCTVSWFTCCPPQSLGCFAQELEAAYSHFAPLPLKSEGFHVRLEFVESVTQESGLKTNHYLFVLCHRTQEI